MFNYIRDIVIKDYVWFAFLIVQTVQSSTTPDPRNQWKNDFTIRHHQQEPQGINKQKQDRNNINDPQKKHHLGTVSNKYFIGGLKLVSWRANLVAPWYKMYSDGILFSVRTDINYSSFKDTK